MVLWKTLYIDNWRWRGIPFYLGTGKRMAKASSMVSICFKQAPQQLFKDTRIRNIEPNWLLLGIQPEQCIRVEVPEYIPTYTAGSWGPPEVQRLFEREDQYWRNSLGSL